MTDKSAEPRPDLHRAQIAMTPEMFRDLKILAAQERTSVTALVVAAVKRTYPHLGK